ncbi:hypothetical protein [Escherichia phage M01]|nr:hypothetical protein [Escherichia phage M01]
MKKLLAQTVAVNDRAANRAFISRPVIPLRCGTRTIATR